MSIFDIVINPIARRVAMILEGTEERNRKSALTRLREYFSGNQVKPLKVRPGQADDNLILNQAGLVVDRSVTMLFGHGLKFKLPEGAEKQQELIDAIMKVNQQELLFLDIGLNGAVYGTPYVKLIPNGIVDPVLDDSFTRLVALDPDTCTIVVNASDRKRVEQYVIEWADGEDNYREITRRADAVTNEDGAITQPDIWVVETWKSAKGQKYELIASAPWEYSFPPIIHCKNLPSVKSVYGVSDIEQILTPQDRLNFVNSNIAKIIRYHAHPKTVGIGMVKDQLEKMAVGADDMILVSSKDAHVSNLEMQSDLASSRAFSQDIQREIDNISRTMDTSSLADKVGQLTNFGLRVLYADAISKNETKRRLYGEMLLEIVRRLLVIGGMDGEDSDPGMLEWGDALPANEVEKAQMVREDYAAGLIDQETAIRLRGYDPEEIMPKMKAEAAAKKSAGGNLLAEFLAGRNQ